MLNYDQAIELNRLSREQARLDVAYVQLGPSGLSKPVHYILTKMDENNRKLSELFMLAREEVTTTQSQTPPAYVVLVGNPIDGMTIVGPFQAADDALDHAERELEEPWFITHLEAPQEDE